MLAGRGRLALARGKASRTCRILSCPQAAHEAAMSLSDAHAFATQTGMWLDGNRPVFVDQRLFKEDRIAIDDRGGSLKEELLVRIHVALSMVCARTLGHDDEPGRFHGLCIDSCSD